MGLKNINFTKHYVFLISNLMFDDVKIISELFRPILNRG